jgi:N-acetylneuraminic acid mutarotase
MAQARHDAAAASLNGSLYVAGGWFTTPVFISTVTLSSVERFSPSTNSWEPVATMGTKRTNFQLVALGGQLYTIGGWGDGISLNLVERFDPTKNLWTAVASMQQSRDHHSAAVMGGVLYVAGGSEESDWPDILRSCERYDAVTDSWSFIADLPAGRTALAMACLGGSLYAIGGCEPNDLVPANLSPFAQAAVDAFFDSDDWDWGELTSSLSPPWRYDATADAWVEAPLVVASLLKVIGYGTCWIAL